MAKGTKDTDEEKVRKQVLDNLATIGKLSVGDDGLVFEGDKFSLPVQYRDDLAGARRFLEDWEQNQETSFNFSRAFRYRPWDGAAAFQRALKRAFNHTGIGTARHSFFGTRPPIFRSIEVGPNETIQIPWGSVRLPQLNAEFELGVSMNEEYGVLFDLEVEAPKKYRPHIEAFFDLVQDELKHRSIYRGKAINGAHEPGFIDLSRVDPSKVVYTDRVLRDVDANLWTLLEKTDTMRKLGIPLKRAVLFHGPFGSGKSLMGNITAQKATANGWTYILCRPGHDDLFEVLRTAQVYAPAMVWFEDIDQLASGGDAEQVAKLLDYLDGISNKGSEVIAGFTTNHVDKIIRGVLRPGRIDALIEVGSLAQTDIAKMVKVSIPAELLDPDIDYTQVEVAFRDYVPAFCKEAIDRAVRYMVVRNGGDMQKITTADIVNAAEGLRAQFDLMHGATTNRLPDSLSTALQAEVRDAVVGTVGLHVGGRIRPLTPVNGG